ncbi:Beta-barrel assembly machine subunit BamA [Granulicella rosea]|uniref:Beta-barrel assembly machine subunit BamA n=1 Tax=Granulicella rosea TaxID=474952 RepID=A0A239E1N6_9BACT|nr:POTRA domain-containing protein [Granulicella rosea]SNS38409.1 Beta-barrel assembly machine subunit BamA [Granulicella rosea]
MRLGSGNAEEDVRFSPSRRRVWAAVGLFLASGCAGFAHAQSTPGGVGSPATLTSGDQPNIPATVPQASQAATPNAPDKPAEPEGLGPALPPLATNLAQWKGLTVDAIKYDGVIFEKSDRLTGELTQKAGQPLDPQKVQQTTRRLFATGRYMNIAVRGERHGDSVTLIFTGVARYYVGRVQIDGVKSDQLTSLLEYGSKLNPGVAFNDSDVSAGTDALKGVLQQNGYYQPKIVAKTERDDAGQQVNVTYTVDIGPQARIGAVKITGDDPGVTEPQFRKKGKLKQRSKVNRQTTSNALDNMRKFYQKNNRLEATTTLRSSTYDPSAKTLNYEFQASQGPIVKVVVEGAKVSKSRLHLLVPIFEEGTIDNDLLNEGTHNIKDFMQQQGYFDVTVAVKVIGDEKAPTRTVLYTVDKGLKHKVLTVEVKGNKYFGSELLKESLRVQKADAYLRSGRYSQSLVTSDEKSMEALYRSNGFNQAKVTSSVKDTETVNGKPLKIAQIGVVYTVAEGPQQTFGGVDLHGVDPSRQDVVNGLLNARDGQPFSLITLSGDRDAILAYYLSNGFDQARIEVKQEVEGQDPSKTDVNFNVSEGKQVFIGHTLLSGIKHVKPDVVNQQLRVHPEDPLDQSALLETQRNLYNLAVFNEVVAAVQNPTGDAEQKNVLVQLTEAKRWDVTYGFGFEAQTGTPTASTLNAASETLVGDAKTSQEGKPGISPRVTLDVTRLLFRGKDETLAFHGTYGLLERVATVTFQNPHLRNSKSFALQLSGGYSNVQNITTFASSTLQGDIRVTEKLTRKDTFIYDFQYRRVAVDPDSLQVSANLIPLLSQPVRVGGPGITWFHDTRTPSALDAYKGSYTSVQDFFASSKFGSQTDFNRVDVTNSTYYTFGKHKYVFARSTRFGFITSFGDNPNATSTSCVGILLQTNASCQPTPLPERLYAGGATSHRGFPINGAGPRDLQTGFPVGGSGAFVNTFELRLPAPTLPYVGSSVSFVLFHDMGNVFQNVSDVFPSFTKFHQPNEQTCENVSQTFGTCNFNYFSHAIGIGARYKTPVGPIRVDFPYNLNPPRYPVILDFGNRPPYVGQASHFNFFFSIGQSF